MAYKLKIFRVCPKCRAQYLLFHLKSDCQFAVEKFQFFRALIIKSQIDKQLSKFDKNLFDTNTLKLLNSDHSKGALWKFYLLEYARILSVPFLINTVIVFLGVFLFDNTQFKTWGNRLQAVSVIIYFLWIAYLIQGGLDIIFKRILLLDLMHRYKLKK